MKKIFPFFGIALMALSLTISCGSDDESSSETSAVSSYDARHSIENCNQLAENGLITYNEDYTSASVKFAAKKTDGVNLTMVLSGANGKKIAEYPATYSTEDNMYHVTLSNLAPGNIYFYYIAAYDTEGIFISRANEGSFTIPQIEGPEALTGLTAYAPTAYYSGYITGESITTDVEYSVDGGETWASAEENGIIEGLPIGNVLVRIAATTSRLAGKSVEITIPGNTDFNATEEEYAEGENSRSLRLSK